MSDKKHTKRRLSKIDGLPDDFKSYLDMLLRDKKLNQTQIREEINKMIYEAGVRDDPEYIKRNALSRYSQTFHERMEKFSQYQEMSNQWVRQFGEKPQSDMVRLLVQIGTSQIADFQMAALEKDKTLDAKTLGNLALAVKRFQEAEAGSVKLEKEIRKQALEDAAEKAESVAKKAGMTSETVKMLKAELLGIE